MVDNDILYIPDLAALLNTTEAAIRTRMQRQNNLPPHSRIGGRIVWTRTDYEQWLKSLTTIKSKTDE